MRSIRILTALAVLCLFPSCVGFQQKFQDAHKAFPPPNKTIEGAWIGSWKSGANGHEGKLRCVITKIDADSYEFYYWATWARVMSGGFKIECDVAKKDGKWTFSGEKDLGALGGRFGHSGTATPTKIDATFRSIGGPDRGTFELKRVE